MSYLLKEIRGTKALPFSWDRCSFSLFLSLFTPILKFYCYLSRYHVYHSPVQSAIHNNNNNQRMTTALDTHNRRPLGNLVYVNPTRYHRKWSKSGNNCEFRNQRFLNILKKDDLAIVLCILIFIKDKG